MDTLIFETLGLAEGRRDADLVRVLLEDEYGYFPAWEGFIVKGEAADGGVYFHTHTFEEDEEGRASRFLARLEAHLQAGGTFDPNHWNFVRYAYGSTGWVRHEEPALVAADRSPGYEGPPLF